MTWRRILTLALACVAAANSPMSSQRSGDRVLKTVLISLDGASDQIMDRLIERGVVPALASIARSGVAAEFAVSSFPGKTAPGHAALFSGAYSDVNGIVSNAIIKRPFAKHSVLETASGYSNVFHTSEPIWAAAARQGIRTVTLYPPHAAPVERFPSSARSGNLIAFEAYDRRHAPYAIINEKSAIPSSAELRMPASEAPVKTFQVRVGQSRLSGAVVDSPGDNRQAYDRVYVSTTSDLSNGTVLTLSDSGLSAPLSVRFKDGPSMVRLRLLHLSPDGHTFKILQTAAYVNHVNDLTVEQRIHREGLYFVGNGAADLYLTGELGKTLARGGDGTAERLFLETARLTSESLIAIARFALRNLGPEFLVGYTPYPDEIFHRWYGYLDPRRDGYDPELATKLTPLFEEGARLADEYLKAIVAEIPEGTPIIVSTDHGMATAWRDFFPNVVLQRAGLLTFDNKGQVDITRSRVLYSVEDGGFLRVNSNKFRGGIVPLKDVTAVVQKAKAALAAARDPLGPKHDQPIVTTFFERGSHASVSLGLEGPFNGDLYIDVAPGYNFSGRSARDIVLKRSEPIGEHTYCPDRPDMRAILYMGGRGFRTNGVIGPVRLIDVAPTVARLLQISPPMGTRGRALVEAFEEKH